MNHAQPTPALRALTDELLDAGTLPSEEAATLAHLLNDDEARAWFLSMVHQEALLEQYFDPTRQKTNAPAETENKNVSANRIHFFAAGIAAAAAVLIGFAFALFPKTGDSPGNEYTTLARITGSVGPVWDKTAMPDDISAAHTPRKIALLSGFAELTYATDVRITLEGPCVFSVTDSNSGRLDSGKIVARVPQNATGFSIDSEFGKVVDKGTEFAMDITGKDTCEIGVFEGEINLARENEELSLHANQSLAITADGEVQHIPLNREKFSRQLPTRDFRWELKTAGSQKFSADVSRLITKPSVYNAVFKIFNGDGTVKIRNVKLLAGDKEIARNAHEGSTSRRWEATAQNTYSLAVSDDAFRQSGGRWTLEAELESPAEQSGGRNAPQLGLMQLEEGLFSSARAQDFIGTWEYSYKGVRYERTFFPDGTAKLLRNNLPEKKFLDAVWKTNNGILTVTFPNSPYAETHAMRDNDTLIFLQAPYENAKRKSAEKN